MTESKAEKVTNALHQWAAAQPKVITHETDLWEDFTQKTEAWVIRTWFQGKERKEATPVSLNIHEHPRVLSFLTVEAMANLYWPWLHLMAEEYSTSTIGELATDFLLRHGQAFIPEKPMGSEQVQISGLSEDVS